MFPILTGFTAGALHVFSGVDHLAALAPAAVADPSKAARTGFLWGLGHGLGVVLVGLVALAFREVIDIEEWAGWAEFIVGFLIVGIGIWAIWRSRTIEIHEHPHEHEDTGHAETEDPDAEHDHLHAHSTDNHTHHRAVLGVGVFHGIAGGGHLFAVLPALALPTASAVVYLISYLIASVLAMGGFGWAVGVLTKKAGSAWIRRLMAGSGVLAVVVGVAWIANSWPW
ncbi:MAG: hydantoin utilization protein A [Acidimicrobiia bacterium]